MTITASFAAVVQMMDQQKSNFNDHERRFHAALEIMFQQWKVGKDAETKQQAHRHTEDNAQLLHKQAKSACTVAHVQPGAGVH